MNHISEKALVSRKHTELSKLNKKTSNSIQKEMDKRLNRHFTKADMQMAI